MVTGDTPRTVQDGAHNGQNWQILSSSGEEIKGYLLFCAPKSSKRGYPGLLSDLGLTKLTRKGTTSEALLDHFLTTFERSASESEK